MLNATYPEGEGFVLEDSSVDTEPEEPSAGWMDWDMEKCV